MKFSASHTKEGGEARTSSVCCDAARRLGPSSANFRERAMFRGATSLAASSPRVKQGLFEGRSGNDGGLAAASSPAPLWLVRKTNSMKPGIIVVRPVNTHVDPFQTESSSMSSAKPAFIFVHGGWVDSSIWRLVIPLLKHTVISPGRSICPVQAVTPKSPWPLASGLMPQPSPLRRLPTTSNKTTAPKRLLPC